MSNGHTAPSTITGRSPGSMLPLGTSTPPKCHRCYVSLVRSLCPHPTENYQGLVTCKRGPVRLILGPWTHGNRSYSYAGNVHFGPAANMTTIWRRTSYPALALGRALVTRRQQRC